MKETKSNVVFIISVVLTLAICLWGIINLWKHVSTSITLHLPDTLISYKPSRTNPKYCSNVANTLNRLFSAVVTCDLGTGNDIIQKPSGFCLLVSRIIQPFPRRTPRFASMNLMRSAGFVEYACGSVQRTLNPTNGSC